MTATLYQRFDAPGVAALDRFEHWRAWYSQAIDVPMQLELVHKVPPDFDASAEALGVGDVDIVEYHFGEAVGSWTREAVAARERLRLVIVAPALGATGSWHRQELSLSNGAAVLLGSTEGRWRAPNGLHAIQVNVPRHAIPVTDRQLETFNDQRRLRDDPAFAWLIRPELIGLAGHLNSVADRGLPELEGLWISLLTMLMRSLAGKDTDGTDTATTRRLQIQRHIRANLADPRLSPTTIADALHLSRRSLYAALSPDDEGVAAEIRRQRLDRARAMLLDPSQTASVAEIAATVGLPNAAHFSRVFRARYGLNPSDLRRPPGAVSPATPVPGPDTAPPPRTPPPPHVQLHREGRPRRGNLLGF